MLRGFTDSTGVEWRVWEVFPNEGGNSSADALTRSSLSATPFANGWLCFESSSQKRRLAPIPQGWEFREAVTLEELCQLAVPVQARRNRAASLEPRAAS